MGIKTLVVGAALAIVAGGVWLLAGGFDRGDGVELLNVSYDPTRELWSDLNLASGRSPTSPWLTPMFAAGGPGPWRRPT